MSDKPEENATIETAGVPAESVPGERHAVYAGGLLRVPQ